MSHELQKEKGTLRLPSYRESWLLRFHPYPQTQRNTANVAHLMQTVDRRFTEEPVAIENVENHAVTPLGEAGDSGKTEDALNLDRALGADDRSHIQRRRSLTSLIIDLAVSMTSGVRGIRRRRSLAKSKFGSDI